MRERAIALLLTLGFLAIPAISNAQALGTIAGAVKDASGAILPGVTVEASSSALIEKVRTVVTDGAGQYRIVNLPPGNYTITFALPGFSTVKREGIEVSPNFTSNIDADLRVGAVEETITVTGESPIVDIQSSAQTRAMTDQAFKELPTGGSWIQMAALVPAVRAEQHRRRGRARRSDWRAGVGARKPARRRRVADRRPAYRQHVHRLEPDEHEPVAAALRSGRRQLVRADGRDRHQRRDHERDPEGRWKHVQRVGACQRLRPGLAGQQCHLRSSGSWPAGRVLFAEDPVRHQRRDRRAHQAGQAVVLRHVALLYERILPRVAFLRGRSDSNRAHQRHIEPGIMVAPTPTTTTGA